MSRLSVVMAGRNDNHGGDFAGRMSLALGSLCELDAEIICVEWNPPTDRPALRDALKDMGFRETIERVRFITVPAEIHNRIEGHEIMPMFEYRAKNVGIRAARGEAVLCTNADIMFSREMNQALNSLTVAPDCFYVAQRHDMKEMTDGVAPGYRSAFLKVSRIVSFGDAAGDFTLMAREKWIELRGYPELLANDTLDSIMLNIARDAGMKQVCLAHPIYHQEHDRTCQEGRPHGWTLPALPNAHEDWGLRDVAL